MADISKIKLPDGSSYDIKDATARSGLSGKLGVNDKAASAKTADSVAWNNTGHPATFPPSAHNHDDRYYTESEIEGKRYTTAKVLNGTVDDLYTGRYDTTGGVGSISLSKKSSGIGSEIPAGWYNYIYSPHRDGIGDDNNKYATVILCPMTFSGTSYIIRYSGGAITEVKPIITSHQSLSNYVQTTDSRLSNARQANGGNSATVNGHSVNSDVPANAKFTDTNTWNALKGATTTADGSAGYAPAPTKGSANRYLRSDGTWSVPPDNNTTALGSMSGTLGVGHGGTGATDAGTARSNLGLGNLSTKSTNGSTSQFLRGDGQWVTPPNSQYGAISTTWIDQNLT